MKKNRQNEEGGGKCLHLHGLSEGCDVVKRSGNVNGEIHRIRHVGTSSEIADRLRQQNRVGIVNLLIVESQEHRRQNVHFFNKHLKETKVTIHLIFNPLRYNKKGSNIIWRGNNDMSRKAG